MEYKINNLLDTLSGIDGVLGVALINNTIKEIVHSKNINDRFGFLSTGMSDIIRANIKFSKLSAQQKTMEDILITYSDDIFLLKQVPEAAKYFIFIRIARDANIALTRLRLNEKFSNLSVQ